jgi:hypothetical protein
MSNNTWNVNNDEIPDDFYVSEPSSPMSVASNIGSVTSNRNRFNTRRANQFKKNFNKRWNNEHPSDPVHVNTYVPLTKKMNNTYSNMISKWKARNTSMNKAYKTRANYNANSKAQLRAQLAQATSQAPRYNNGEEHSAQYWQNKRAAAATKAAPSTKTVSKWGTVPSGKLIRTRKNRKNRK